MGKSPYTPQQIKLLGVLLYQPDGSLDTNQLRKRSPQGARQQMALENLEYLGLVAWEYQGAGVGKWTLTDKGWDVAMNLHAPSA